MRMCVSCADGSLPCRVFRLLGCLCSSAGLSRLDEVLLYIEIAARVNWYHVGQPVSVLLVRNGLGL